jgi:hypothetical protein
MLKRYPLTKTIVNSDSSITETIERDLFEAFNKTTYFDRNRFMIERCCLMSRKVDGKGLLFGCSAGAGNGFGG